MSDSDSSHVVPVSPHLVEIGVGCAKTGLSTRMVATGLVGFVGPELLPPMPPGCGGAVSSGGMDSLAERAQKLNRSRRDSQTLFSKYERTHYNRFPASPLRYIGQEAFPNYACASSAGIEPISAEVARYRSSASQIWPDFGQHWSMLTQVRSKSGRFPATFCRTRQNSAQTRLEVVSIGRSRVNRGKDWSSSAHDGRLRARCYRFRSRSSRFRRASARI